MCEGSFGLVIPRGRGRCEYFQIASRPDGLTVRRLSDKVPPKEIERAEYEKLMSEIRRNHEEARRKRAEWQSKMNEPPSAFEIRRVQSAGVVTIKRK